MGPGTFDVSLTVTDDKGNTDTMNQPGLIEVSTEPNTELPDEFRRFVLSQVADQRVLAYGTQFPDMRCVVIWNDDPFHIINFAEISHVIQSVVVTGEKEIFWLDPGDSDEPTVTDDDEELSDEPTGMTIRALS